MHRVVAFAIAIATAFLAGCMTIGHKVDLTKIASFQPGVTTIAQAETILGPPFQTSRMPDGSQQLQYVTQVEQLADDSTPATGSQIPKHTDKTVSTMLSFDQNGHFVRSWSSASSHNNTWPSDLGHMNQGDVPMRSSGG